MSTNTQTAAQLDLALILPLKPNCTECGRFLAKQERLSCEEYNQEYDAKICVCDTCAMEMEF